LIGTPIKPADLLFVFRRRILAEWDKIESYKAKGFIADWP
jgi:hypothetical protein